MRCRLAQIAILDTACLLAGQPPIHAQQTAATAIREIQAERSCPPSSASDDEKPSGPEISIVEVTFSGFLQMAVSDQDQIATSIKQQTRGNSLDEVIDEALERVRAGWQDRGYFKVQVSDDARTLTSNPVSQRVALNVHVDEGLQYSLGEITFKHNKAITSVEALRSLFPINNGDIFRREQIATGLQNLREAYGELGYINFTSVPDTKVDDENKRVSLDIDLDEGKVFYVCSLSILGLDEPAQGELLKDFPLKRGQVYNGRLFGQFLLKHPSTFPDCGCGYREQLDEKAGTVAFTFDFRACPAD